MQQGMEGLPPVIGLEEDASVDSGLQQEASSESDLMDQLASPRMLCGLLRATPPQLKM